MVERKRQAQERRIKNIPQEVLDKKLMKAKKEIEFLNQRVSALSQAKELKNTSVSVC